MFSVKRIEAAALEAVKSLSWRSRFRGMCGQVGQRRASVHPCRAERLEPRRLLSAYALDTLAVFSNTNNAGSMPYSGVVLDSAGDLFGTTTQGGAKGEGSVFEIANGTNSITTLVSFNGANGSQPEGVVLDSNGDLFGTTNAGGVGDGGIVFEIPRGATSFSTLASFNSTDGANPMSGPTLDSNGDLFGATFEGGAANDGAVFEVAQGTNSITILAAFNGANGASPWGGVTFDSNGDLFGTAWTGGANGDGAVYEIPHGATLITALASFNGADGSAPEAGVSLDSSGNLFGATGNGGADGEGTLFEVAQGAASISTLVSFNLGIGANPPAGVTLDSGGDLFGTTYLGGDNGVGTVFELPQGSNSITTLTAFNNANGASPSAGLARDSSGDLFGATASGGTNNDGTVFELAASTIAPSAAISAPDVTSAIASEPITVVYSDSASPIDASTIAASNLTVTGPGGAALAVTLVNTSGSGDSITADYSARPTDGAFSLADDGAYAVAVVAGSVKNLAADGVAAAAGGFNVNVSASTLQDLSATLAASGSSSTIAGTPLKLKEKLTLAASSAVSGEFSVSILLSPDASAADSVMTLASTGGKLKLKAGKGRSFLLKLARTIAASVGAGSYHLLIQLKDTAGVSAAIDSGQTLTVAAPAVDLAAASVELQPSALAAGKKFKMTIVIANESSANVSAVGLLPFDIETSSDGLLSDAVVLLSRTKRISLKPGKSIKITVTATIPDGGPTNLIVNLDPSHTAFADDINSADEIHVEQVAVALS